MWNGQLEEKKQKNNNNDDESRMVLVRVFKTNEIIIIHFNSFSIYIFKEKIKFCSESERARVQHKSFSSNA